MIRRHVAAAQRLDSWLRADDRFEVIAPTLFGLVSFRHIDGDAATDALVTGLNEAGFAIAGSVANERRFIRVSIGSTWTEDRHVDALRSAIDELA